MELPSDIITEDDHYAVTLRTLVHSVWFVCVCAFVVCGFTMGGVFYVCILEYVC